jgi:hypothetical protein
VQKRFSFALGVIAVFLIAGSEKVSAQSKTPKFEVGAQFSLIRFGDLDLDHGVNEPGFGGRFTYNINDHLAAEAEVNFFPKERREEQSAAFAGLVLQGGRKIESLFGIKAGTRRGRFGVFGKVRPGFVHFSHFEREGHICIPEEVCPPNPPPDLSETDFALDVGGVVEFYPTRRAVVRFDLGDTIIHSSSGELIVLPGTIHFILFPGTQNIHQSRRSVVDVTRATSHNLQFTVGIGFRF